MRIGIKVKIYNDHFRGKRIEKGFLTINMLHKFTGINKSTLYAYEGMKAYPTLQHSKLLAETLEADIDYLFPGISKKIVSRLREMKTEQFYITKELKLLPNYVQKQSLLEVDHEEVERVLNNALSDLDDKERKIVELRFLGQNKRSYVSIGKELGLSGMRVAQIEKEALKKLRHPKRSIALSQIFMK